MANFLLSTDIFIYPSSRRLQYDVGSKLSTEENIINTPSLAGNKNYVIKLVTEGDTQYIYFVLGGYFVKAKLNSISGCVPEAAAEIYASCYLIETTLATVDGTEIKTLVLKNINETSSAYLDTIPSGSTDAYFGGIKFSDVVDTAASYSFKILQKSSSTWELCPENIGPVGTSQLQTASITEDKIATDAVTTVKIKNKNVTPEKLGFSEGTVKNSFIVTNSELGATVRKLEAVDIPQLGNITNEGKLPRAPEAPEEGELAVVIDSENKIMSLDLTTAAPVPEGNATTAVTTIKQDANGKIVANLANIPNGELQLIGTNEQSYKLFSANQANNTAIKVNASVGTKLAKEGQTVTVTASDNNINFKFDGITGNGFTKKSTKNDCNTPGDYYVAKDTEECPGEVDTVYIYTPGTTEGEIENFSSAGVIRGTGIKEITKEKTVKNIDTYKITYDTKGSEPTNFNVTNAVSAFGYCTWNGNTATADYPSFIWSTSSSGDLGRTVSLYFVSGYTGSCQLKINNVTKAITTATILPGWYYGKLTSNGWELTPVLIGTAPLGIKDGKIDIAEATETSKGAISANDKEKLNGIAAGAEVNVQSDWNEGETASDAYIKNKPILYANLDKNTIPHFQVISNKITATRGQKTWIVSALAPDPTTGVQDGDILIKY